VNPYFVSAIAIFIFMQFLFVLAVIGGRNDLADVGWGLGFLVVGLACGETFSGHWAEAFSHPRTKLAFSLLIIWALRLSVHIFIRNRGKPEDNRYQEWRKKWGRHPLLGAYLQVFLLQGLLMWMVSIPVAWIMSHPEGSLRTLDFIGVGIWTLGLGWEAVSDFQLIQFKKNPFNKGKIMTSGLWASSRHPNYFGEVLLWWGFYLLALQIPDGWLTIGGPTAITILILKVSGVPLLEKQMDGRPGVAEYRRTTPIFIPWLKRQ
jgi:steroid 5-alpha reductase family enzyme